MMTNMKEEKFLVIKDFSFTYIIITGWWEETEITVKIQAGLTLKTTIGNLAVNLFFYNFNLPDSYLFSCIDKVTIHDLDSWIDSKFIKKIA